MAPGPLYRPGPAEIADLCDRLRADRLLGPGPGDELRLRAALTRLPPQPLDRLGHVVVTVARTDPDRRLLDDAVRPWLRGLRPVVTPDRAPRAAPAAPASDRPAPPDAQRSPAPGENPRHPAWAVALALAVFALGAWLGRPPPPAEAPDTPTPTAERDPLPPAPDDPPAPTPAPIAPVEPTPPPTADADARIAWAATGAFALLLLLVAARTRVPRLVAPPRRPTAPLVPPALPPMALGDTPRFIPREAAHRLGAGSGRAVTDPDSRVFDPAATVRATAARMGRIPAVRFRPTRRPEPIELWIDRRARRGRALDRVVDELTRALDRSGTPWALRHLMPSGKLVDPRGRAHPLDALPVDPEAARVALLTDGAGLFRLRGDRKRSLVRTLRRWPGLAVVRFGGDPDALAAHIDRAAPVLDPDGLVPWLVAVERRPPDPVDLATLRLWAAALALSPAPPTALDALDLRADLGLGLPPTALDALWAELAQSGAAPGDLRGPPSRRAALIGWLRRWDPARFEAARGWWRARLDGPGRFVLDVWGDAGAVDRAVARMVEAGVTAAAVGDPLAHMAPAGSETAGIELPWRWDALRPATRGALRGLGFGAALPRLALAEDVPVRPRRARLGMALALGLAAAAGVGVLGGPAVEGPTVEGPAFERLPETAARPAMVPIAPGRFVMGSPLGEEGRGGDEAQRPVELTRGFWMADSEVTQGQYAAVMGENPAHFQGESGDGARPVERVSWLDAVRYCNELSAREGLGPAYVIEGEGEDADVRWDRDAAGYRLPTEAEWEYAARAGTTTATYADPDGAARPEPRTLDDIAWHSGNSGMKTHPVKGKAANPWGLYDMLGNVREWTWDWYTADPAAPADGAPLADPAGPARGVRRVFRGGSFVDDAHWVRAADRLRWRPGFRSWDLGFRPVRSAPRARP